MEDENFQKYLEASQEVATLTVRMWWGLMFVVTAFILAVAGIYFSEEYISSKIGADVIANAFGWGAAGIISGLEVSSVFLFGNKSLSEIIKSSNKGEFWLVAIIVAVLTIFDFITNYLGLSYQATRFAMSTGMQITGETQFVIILGSILMTVAEILMVFAVRSLATVNAMLKVAKSELQKASNKVLGNGAVRQSTGGSGFSNLPSVYGSGQQTSSIQAKSPYGKPNGERRF